MCPDAGQLYARNSLKVLKRKKNIKENGKKANEEQNYELYMIKLIE